MNNKKEAASMRQHGKRQGTGTLEVPSVPTQNSTTEAAGPQVEISGYLHAGEENAMSMRELKALTGLPSREVRRLIQLERLQKTQIVTTPRGGYHLAANEGERQRFFRSMRHRAGEILRVVAAMEGKETDK